MNDDDDEHDDEAPTLAAITVKRMPPREVKKLAAEIVRGEAYAAWTDHQMSYGFALLLMGVDWRSTEVEKVGLLIGYMKDTMGRSINGVPMFTSCRFVHRNDVPYLREHLDRMEAALDG